ncbi:MAG: HEAT repeat domain-containing protein, partial [Ktedonobacterales bacterium]
LYRLADTPENTATRAGLPSREGARAATLALTLAALCEGLASVLAHAEAAPGGSQAIVEAAQQHLRDLLDAMQRSLQNPDEEERLTAALKEAKRHGGQELADGVTYLARLPALNRLVRAQLAVLLGALASPAAVMGLVELLDEPDAVMRQAVNAAVVLAGAVCVGPLQAALRSPSERVRSRAEEALALLGDEAREAAALTLTAGSGEQRAGAARTLGALRADQAIEPLIRRLDDSESAVRVAAARALGQIANGQALTALEQHSSNSDVALRVAVAQALGQVRDPESLPTLVRLLGDVDATVRAAAADALGLLGDERAVVSLQERRDDPDPWTQRAVVFALRRLGKASG